MDFGSLNGIVQNILVPVILWIALPGAIGGVLLNKYDAGKIGFSIGAGIGALLLFSVGPYSSAMNTGF